MVDRLSDLSGLGACEVTNGWISVVKVKRDIRELGYRGRNVSIQLHGIDTFQLYLSTQPMQQYCTAVYIWIPVLVVGVALRSYCLSNESTILRFSRLDPRPGMKTIRRSRRDMFSETGNRSSSDMVPITGQ